MNSFVSLTSIDISTMFSRIFTKKVKKKAILQFNDKQAPMKNIFSIFRFQRLGK